ncbi:MAG: Protein-L-isoaspartate O-methyltransferase [uncultured Friedmanniella sp.]|uniref:Protein-L-isoaspartate O-methyltransferase n=1 Tax=uncultured Friedmanniella sp. TaxID=335381 RepID=A0A6J4KYN6_9ACTN|nr:phosphoribosyltransferase family protein [uncultured Friedmanniella sp.]CAA9317864.1 MAG: Protein-L-isoaspartate O-methyltransferase [uncultured Friedmanniella sp.]
MFANRTEAGRRLATHLTHLRQQPVVVLGLPRGGVPVASPVAEYLEAPLDVLVVRKLGFPGQPELAVGALGEGGVRLVDDELVKVGRVSTADLRQIEQREARLLQERVERLRSGRPRIELRDRIAVVVDDGLATGWSARVACTVARRLGAARIVLAVPVAPAPTLERLPEADEVVCVEVPERFLAVGLHYRDFNQTPEQDVVKLLDAAARRMGPEVKASGPASPVSQEAAD